MGSEPLGFCLAKVRMSRHWQPLALLATVCVILFTPVLLSPHWGMIDDPCVVIEPSRRAMHDPSVLSDLLFYRGRIGFYYWSLFLWHLFPDNPRGFYSINCLILIASIWLTYGSSYLLCKRRSIAVVATSLVFVSSGLFEVIYALDKPESYLPLLLNATVFGYLYSLSCDNRRWIVFLPITVLCASLAYITKESSMILCLLSGALLGSVAILSAMQKRPDKRRLIARLAILFVATVLPLLVKCVVFPAETNGYLVITLDGIKLLTKSIGYVHAIPEFFILLLMCSATCVWLPFSLKLEEIQWQECAFASLLATCALATIALISFDTFDALFQYIWFPVYFLLAPVLAYAIGAIQRKTALPPKKLHILLSALMLAFVVLALASGRVLQAQFQLGINALNDDLSKILSQLVSKSGKSIVGAVPVFVPQSYNIPENIEFFVRSQLEPDYYDDASEQLSGHQFTMLNFLSFYRNDKPLHGDKNVFELGDLFGKHQTYKIACPANYIGWTGFQVMGASTSWNQKWVKRPFTTGNWLIVPYGDLPPNKILYRCGGMFCVPPRVHLLAFPQMHFKELGTVERTLINITGRRAHIGWRIFEIDSDQPVSISASSDGWLPANKPVYYLFNKDKPVLRIVSDRPVPNELHCVDGCGNKSIVIPTISGAEAILDIHLKPCRNEKGEAFILLSPPVANNEKPFLHISKIEYRKE